MNSRIDLPSWGTTSRLRLRGFDYSSAGCYLVTCVAIDRAPLFGKVKDSIFHPSTMGTVLVEEWLALEAAYDSVMVDVHQVMPDHFHGIVTLLRDDRAPTTSLSAVMGRFKSLTARRYWHERDEGNCPDVGTTCWQARFHDTIIRDDRHYDEVVGYLALNPHRWTQRGKS